MRQMTEVSFESSQSVVFQQGQAIWQIHCVLLSRQTVDIKSVNVEKQYRSDQERLKLLQIGRRGEIKERGGKPRRKKKKKKGEREIQQRKKEKEKETVVE